MTHLAWSLSLSNDSLKWSTIEVALSFLSISSSTHFISSKPQNCFQHCSYTSRTWSVMVSSPASHTFTRYTVRESGQIHVVELWCFLGIFWTNKCVIIVTPRLSMVASFICSLCQDILPNDSRRRNKLHGSSCVDINKIMLTSET